MSNIETPYFSSGKFTKVYIICGKSTNLHPDGKINFPQCCRYNNARIKITRRRKILGEDLGGKKGKSDVFYSLQKKKAYNIVLNSLFINKTLHTFMWSFQSKILCMWCHTRFLARSGQSRQFRSATWKSFNKNKSSFQYLPLSLCKFYLTVLKLLCENVIPGTIYFLFLCFNSKYHLLLTCDIFDKSLLRSTKMYMCY